MWGDERGNWWKKNSDPPNLHFKVCFAGLEEFASCEGVCARLT